MKHITHKELESWKDKSEDFHLLDVREVEEHSFFNIGGQLLPLSEIFIRKDELPRSGKVVVYCKRGIRSQVAIQRLAPLFPDCEFYNLANGVWDLMPH